MRYRQSDVFLIPRMGPKFAVGRIVLKLRGNILVAIYPEWVGSADAAVLKRLPDSQPVFLVETMDAFVRDGSWKPVGNWTSPTELPIPVYKTQVWPSGDFHEQHIDGTVGKRLTFDEAAGMKPHRSFSPPLVEYAVLALQGIEPWLALLEEIWIGGSR